MAQGAVPIFGTSRLSTTEENVKALEVKLSDEEVASIRKLAVDVESQIEGDRGNEHMKKLEFA